MVFSLILWMPSWGGMINGLMTLRGAWQRVATDPVLKFFVVGVTFYGMSTFEGPMLSIKSVNVLSHYTDWTIGHVHGGTLGWNGMMIFGMLYWMAPRLFQSDRMSNKLAEWHFWLATLGIFMYWLSMQWAGITQGLMWRAFDAAGALQYPDFVETVTKLIPLYWIRAIGGTIYFVGTLIGVFALFSCWMGRPKKYVEQVHEAPALKPHHEDASPYRSDLSNVMPVAKKIDELAKADWHRRWEHLPLKFTLFVVLSVSAASIFSLVPMFVIKSNIKTIESVKPYTPLEVYGRDVYIAEGCYNCHSQMIRPIWAETSRYGAFSESGEFVYDHPFQWGSRRLGTGHAPNGGEYAADRQVVHIKDPPVQVAGAIMPGYAHLLEQEIDWSQAERSTRALNLLGAPYTDEVLENAAEIARAEAAQIAAAVAENSEEPDLVNLETKKVIALTAYLQRLGTDLSQGPGWVKTVPMGDGREVVLDHPVDVEPAKKEGE